MKKIAILGSTGSIGMQTLDVIRHQMNDFEVVALSAGHQIDRLEQQVREFHPKIVSLWEEEDANKLKIQIRDLDVKVLYGMEGLLEVSTYNGSEILVTAIVGMMGIQPTVAALQAGKTICLANKETLVTAGHIIMPLKTKLGGRILPVDSEHSAIFQSLNGQQSNRIHKILLTASGGPFRGWTRERLQNVTVEDALKHPNWSMGRKITVDSATLVNKGLEVMEAKWLFGVEPEQIQVIVHPQSIIHSMVEYEDGAVIAQLGTPDMRLPIQYALNYPNRKPVVGQRLDFSKVNKLTFETPDVSTFVGLPLAIEALKKGGNMPAIYNAANEIAVDKFLNHKLHFLQISELIEDCMAQIPYTKAEKVEEILETQHTVNEYLESRW